MTADMNFATVFQNTSSNLFPVYATELTAIVLILGFAFLAWKMNLPAPAILPLGLILFYALSVLFHGIFDVLFMAFAGIAVGGVVILGIMQIISR